MSECCEPKFIFMTEIVVITNFSCEEKVCSNGLGTPNQEVTSTATKGDALHSLLRPTREVKIFYLKFSLEKLEKIHGIHRLRQIAH